MVRDHGPLAGSKPTGLYRQLGRSEQGGDVRDRYREGLRNVQAEAKACDAAAAGHELQETFTSSRSLTLTLRRVCVMLIQEYARRNGHAEFLRERTDGATDD
ncbi:DUF664 domain-containing protein [Streptomyces sp. NPDC057460]|uniref:mycothiol transferase n=1 Tax=Streptomyces sp. NPDC057460 TaxID=3346141 RepID=UPI00367EADCF